MRKKTLALRNKKGFTLIEIIVVLVILAILAAAAIPSMIGFIDDSKGKAMVAEARTAYVAAQAVLTEDLTSDDPEITLPASGDDDVIDDLILVQSTEDPATAPTGKLARMLSPDIDYRDLDSVIVDENGVVQSIVYNKGTDSGTSHTTGIYWVKLEPGKPAQVEKTAAGSTNPFDATGA